MQLSVNKCFVIWKPGTKLGMCLQFKHPCSLFTEKGFRDRDEKRFRLSALNMATACETGKKKKNDKKINGIIGMP